MIQILIIVILFVILGVFLSFGKKENFDASGLVYNIPPQWFRKDQYKLDDWLVRYSPEQISDPYCMTKSRGDPKILNYMSSAYRFWRM